MPYLVVECEAGFPLELETIVGRGDRLEAWGNFRDGCIAEIDQLTERLAVLRELVSTCSQQIHILRSRTESVELTCSGK